MALPGSAHSRGSANTAFLPSHSGGWDRRAVSPGEDQWTPGWWWIGMARDPKPQVSALLIFFGQFPVHFRLDLG